MSHEDRERKFGQALQRHLRRDALAHETKQTRRRGRMKWAGALSAGCCDAGRVS